MPYGLLTGSTEKQVGSSDGPSMTFSILPSDLNPSRPVEPPPVLQRNVFAEAYALWLGRSWASSSLAFLGEATGLRTNQLCVLRDERPSSLWAAYVTFARPSTGVEAGRPWNVRTNHRVRTVRMEPSASSALNWLLQALSGDTEKSTSDELVEVINGLNDLLKSRQFSVVDLVLKAVDVKRLSPEMLLAFSRTTFAVRSKLSMWRPFVMKAKQELNRRAWIAPPCSVGLFSRPWRC
jgi:hypothetical protein